MIEIRKNEFDGRIALEYPQRITSRQLADMKPLDAKIRACQEFSVLDKGTQEEVRRWIFQYLVPSEKPRVSAYGLKHSCEGMLTRQYLSCTEMKGALLYAGYVPSNTREVEWFFNVSAQSPLFTRDIMADADIDAMSKKASLYWNAFHKAVEARMTERETFDRAWGATIADGR